VGLLKYKFDTAGSNSVIPVPFRQLHKQLRAVLTSVCLICSITVLHEH
jgi:hypothetical protein